MLRIRGFEMSNSNFDVVIIGGGPAGLTAGIYASRDGLKTLLLEKGLCGGLPATTSLIENYPGFPQGTNGMELMQKFKEQAQRFGTEIIELKDVVEVGQVEEKKIIKTGAEEYIARSLIIATGSVPKKLNIPGENEFYGKGVSYCATCDGPLYRGRDVAVIGCGNSGLQEGEALINYVNSVKFVEFLPYMTGEKILQDRLQESEKTEFFLNHMLTSINGGKLVDSVTAKNRQTEEEVQLDVSGVFIYAGFLPNSGFLGDIVELDESGYIITDENMETSVPGIYAAGDVRSKKIRQIDVACGEGTIAAISARDHLKGLQE
jgi:thioredoxin reductase (NADPH)